MGMRTVQNAHKEIRIEKRRKRQHVRETRREQSLAGSKRKSCRVKGRDGDKIP